MTMKVTDEQLKKIITKTLYQLLHSEQTEESSCKNQVVKRCGGTVPVEASGRHIHLSVADLERLFGKGYVLTKKKDISQPGQYLCEERVTLVGPKGEISNVAVLGPVREETQIELSSTDCRLIGIKPVVRMSGELDGAQDIQVVNGDKKIDIKGAVIVAQNHVHMTPEDAKAYGVINGQLINIRIDSERSMVFENVPVRVSDTAKLAFHIDFDEANACCYNDGMVGTIIGYRGLSKSDASNAAMKGFCISDPQNGMCNRKMCQKACFEKIVTERDILDAAMENVKIICVRNKTIITPLAKDTISEKGMSLEII